MIKVKSISNMKLSVIKHRAIKKSNILGCFHSYCLHCQDNSLIKGEVLNGRDCLRQ